MSSSSSATTTTTTSSPALSRLEDVLNARDLASATPRIAAGRMFRSGNPANGSLNDVKILRMDLKIQQLIDFRSTEEQKEDKGWHLMLSNGDITCYDANGKVTSASVDRNAELAGVDLPQCNLHRLSLLERERFIRALLWRLPVTKVVKAVAYKVLGYEEQMRDTLVP